MMDLEPTQITLLPSQLSQLFLLPKTALMSLSRIIVSGEPFSESLFLKCRKLLPNCQIVNLYGQTESTGDVLYAILTDMEESSAVVDGIVAVGKPILPCIQIELTEKDRELVVSGNLANGYLRDIRPFTKFATGDTGFFRNDIWYVQGRCNELSKINGVLTSPSEIEAAFEKLYSGIAGSGYASCSLLSVAAVISEGAAYIVTERPVPSSFSRQHMKDTGLPWNLIPRKVFCHTIPVQENAARKIDRAALHALVERLVREDKCTRNESSNSSSDKQEIVRDAARNISLEYQSGSIRSIIAKVLKLTDVDEQKSFVELGGDSASAVTLLYHLRLAKAVSAPSFHATEILEARNIRELLSLIHGNMERQSKQQRLSTNDSVLLEQEFRPKPAVRYTDTSGTQHVLVSFRACVDASPVSLNDGSIVVGCQGGVIQKVSVSTGETISYRHLVGWMIQASCVVFAQSLVFCAHSRSSRGLVISLSQNLNSSYWEQTLDAPAKCAPVLLGNEILVSLGKKLLSLDVTSGAQLWLVEMTDTVHVGPMLTPNKSAAFCIAGKSLVRVTSSKDEWIDAKAKRLKTTVEEKYFEHSFGCVYKDLLLDSNGDSKGSALMTSVIATGANGSIFFLETVDSVALANQNVAVKTTEVSEAPLSAAVAESGADLAVGSYDGYLSFVSKDRGEVTSKVHMGGAVFSKPLIVPRENDKSGHCCGGIIVTTTAGDVVLVRDGLVVWRCRISAELWSDPVLVSLSETTVNEKGAHACKMRSVLAFGGRDSKLHLINLD